MKPSQILLCIALLTPLVFDTDCGDGNKNRNRNTNTNTNTGPVKAPEWGEWKSLEKGIEVRYGKRGGVTTLYRLRNVGNRKVRFTFVITTPTPGGGTRDSRELGPLSIGPNESPVQIYEPGDQDFKLKIMSSDYVD